MVWKPDVTVAAVVERDGLFLVVEERIGERVVLNQPAGHIENGETLLEAVVRETLEETAWRFMPAALLGLYHWRSPRGRSTLRVAFTGAVEAFDPERPLDSPIIATHWLSYAHLKARTAQCRTPLVLQCIEHYLAGRRLPLEAIAEARPPGECP